MCHTLYEAGTGVYKCKSSDSWNSGGTEERDLPQWKEGFQEEVMLLKTQSLGRRGLTGCEALARGGWSILMTVPPQLSPGEESRDPKGNEGCQEEGTLDRQKRSKAGCGLGPLSWSSGLPWMPFPKFGSETCPPVVSLSHLH